MRKILVVGLSSNDSMRGVERVVFETVKELAHLLNEKGGGEITLLAGRWQDYYSPLTSFGVKVVHPFIGRGLLFRHLYSFFVIPLMTIFYDVVHFFNPIPIAFSFASSTSLTVHDVAEFSRPDKYSFFQSMYRRLVLKHLMRFVGRVVTVSDFSRNEIIRYFPDASPIVVYNGLEHLSGRNLSDDLVSVVPGRYIFSYGVVEKTKGLDIALETFCRLKSRYSEFSDLKFVFSGAPGNLSPFIEPYLLRDDVLYLGRIDDASLCSLIRKAQIVCFLSEYEGFGFPAAEAVILGARVVVSKGTVLEEICEPYGIPVDISSIDLCVDAFRDALNGEKGGGGKDYMLRRYSWGNAARILVNDVFV